MLFNSNEFIFFFFPFTLALFFVLGLRWHRAATVWLWIASLIFYGGWNPAFLPLLIASILFNFLIAHFLSALSPDSHSRRRTALLIFGLAVNLAALFHYKYAGFLFQNLNEAFGWHLPPQTQILPLGISFFTFTQIAYLVDTWSGVARPFGFHPYVLFVTYFPHLIAGPILHHGEMQPQFSSPRFFKIQRLNLAIGLTYFVIGLVKKLFFADVMAQYVGPVFQSPTPLTFLEAWGGLLSYTLQIYFDFSGYCDMAMGLSRCFNVRLPLNFNSPYKAQNLVDFWRRWHMTLSRWINDYIYLPMALRWSGGHLSALIAITIATMGLSGIWHGAGWTFVIWGLLHGLYISIFHLWTHFRNPGSRLDRIIDALAQPLTLLGVMIGWVFFRAESMESASRVLTGLVATHGWGDFNSPLLGGWYQGSVMAALFFVALKFPNSQEWLRRYRPTLQPVQAHPTSLRFPLWRPTLWFAVAIGLAFGACLVRMRTVKAAEFIYFNF